MIQFIEHAPGEGRLSVADAEAIVAVAAAAGDKAKIETFEHLVSGTVWFDAEVNLWGSTIGSRECVSVLSLDDLPRARAELKRLLGRQSRRTAKIMAAERQSDRG